MIDWVRVEELRSEVGDDGFAEIVEMFLEEVESVVQRLEADPEVARLEADLHFLKGGAWNLGFSEFGALCQDGENKAAAGRADTIDVGRVLASYYASRDAFVNGLAARAAGRCSAA